MTEDAFRIVVAATAALATLAFVVQAAMMIAVYRVSTKTQRVVTRFVGDVMPVLADTGTALATANRIMHDTRPQIQEVAADAVVIAKAGREQVEHLGDFLHYVDERARTRLEQIDSIVESAVARVEHVGNTVKCAAVKPAKEVNGLAVGISAAVSALMHGLRRPGADLGGTSHDLEDVSVAEKETGECPENPYVQRSAEDS